MIVDLKSTPQHIPTLAAWHHEQWSHLYPGISVEQRIERMKRYLGDEPIPTMYVWVDDGEVLGSAALVASDMDTRPELTPWLASVYVSDAHRRRGIGAALVRAVMAQARELGSPELFLFTPDKEDFYAGLGWRTLAKEPYRGEPVTVMTIALD